MQAEWTLELCMWTCIKKQLYLWPYGFPQDTNSSRLGQSLGIWPLHPPCAGRRLWLVMLRQLTSSCHNYRGCCQTKNAKTGHNKLPAQMTHTPGFLVKSGLFSDSDGVSAPHVHNFAVVQRNLGHNSLASQCCDGRGLSDQWLSGIIHRPNLMHFRHFLTFITCKSAKWLQLLKNAVK